jgi:hypothetical protein
VSSGEGIMKRVARWRTRIKHLDNNTSCIGREVIDIPRSMPMAPSYTSSAILSCLKGLWWKGKKDEEEKKKNVGFQERKFSHSDFVSDAALKE